MLSSTFYAGSSGNVLINTAFEHDIKSLMLKHIVETKQVIWDKQAHLVWGRNGLLEIYEFIIPSTFFVCMFQHGNNLPRRALRLGSTERK